MSDELAKFHIKFHIDNAEGYMAFSKRNGEHSGNFAEQAAAEALIAIAKAVESLLVDLRLYAETRPR